MSTPINDGGPAFPVACSANGTPLRVSYQDTEGMSLRDWFAGQAMAAFLGREDEHIYGHGKVAELAYQQADAMLAARGAK